VSRRDQIKMTAAEIAAFLDEQRIVVVATNGRDGFPHQMPLWYVVRDGELWGWTYAKSQKVRNLERDPRATTCIESGVRYDELRGVMCKTRVVLHRELEVVAGIGADLFARYAAGSVDDSFLDAARAQAPKRVGLQFVVEGEPATWDHGKLGGTY
jgi:hypothetical protein